MVHIGRATSENINILEDRCAMGFEPFEIKSNMTPDENEANMKLNQ
jgi:hypothetical protein